jgi:RNA polymerase sigma-70 factor (ECF subfamily)
MRVESERGQEVVEAGTSPAPAGARRAAARPAPGPTPEERERSDREDTEWMRRFQQGDARAFERLLSKHRRAVHAFCLRMLGERTAAEDATQEVFLRVVKGSKSWERQAKFSTWLFTIARNHCIDAIRKASYRKTASLDQPLGDDEDRGPTLGDRVSDPDGIGPDRGAESERLRPLLARAVASLSEEQKEVFVMREYAGMPFKDIAEVVGVPENTVKSRMRYALEHLRKRLREAGIGPEIGRGEG